jgi:hypothetical protein
MPVSIEVIRERKRLHMAKVRSDPARREKLNASRRGNPKYAQAGRVYTQHLQGKHFFRWRARQWGNGVTARMLASLWKRQRGLCALSGRKLDRTAHIDHIVPASLGGSDEIGNLRWLDPWVNTARGTLTDDEFRRRCFQVAEWIGRRIMEATTNLPADVARER